MNKKKKVLFTATVDSYILQFHIPFLKLFKDKGYEVHVATNGKEKIPYCDVKHTVCFERNPFKINNLKAITQLKKICEEEKFDIIHTHTPMGSVVTRLAAKHSRNKYHTRLIYTAHGFHFFKNAPIKNWLLYYPIEKLLSKYTDCIITINKEDYDLAKKKFKKCNQIEYVPGVGIDDNKFNKVISNDSQSKLRKSLGLENNDFVLTCIARLDSNKNQGFLIKVVKKLIIDYPNIHLLLIGPDENNGIYKKMAADILNNVHFLGYRNDIPELLNITNVLVSSSLREGLPVNILEAMISGLPIVATDARGVRDLVKNNRNGYLVNLDEVSFSKKILDLYNDKRLINKFSQNNKKDVNEYLLKNILIKMDQIYSNIIKKNVLHLLSSNSFSGAENVSCQIIRLFNQDNDYSLYYCSPRGKIEKKLQDLKIQYIPIDSMNVSCLKKILDKYNIDIIHSHDVRASVLASFVNKNIDIISHIHGNHLYMRKYSIQSLLFYIRSKRFKHIFWVSDSSYENFCFKKSVNNKSSILMNVIDEKEIMRKVEEDNKKYNYDLIFLGRLNEAKNPMRMIKIIKNITQKIPNLKSVIVGNGELYNDIKKYVDDNNLNGNVDLLGYVENPYKILFSSKVMIMTSIHEGLPMVVLEATSLGIPIVSTPTDGIVKIIKDNYNGFLIEKDADFTNIIIQLLTDKSFYNSIKSNIIVNNKKLNNLEKYYNEVRSIYEK